MCGDFRLIKQAALKRSLPRGFVYRASFFYFNKNFLQNLPRAAHAFARPQQNLLSDIPCSQNVVVLLTSRRASLREIHKTRHFVNTALLLTVAPPPSALLTQSSAGHGYTCRSSPAHAPSFVRALGTRR